jgi:hypothetical protein
MKKTLTLIMVALCAHHLSYAQSDGLPRGAYQLPYTRYEADNAVLDGGATIQSSPQFIQTDIASEASDQRYVSLSANNASIEWTVSATAQGVDLRFTMPDDNTGNGRNGSLGLYVNGTKVKDIALSSYWAYQYFPQYDPVQTPGGKTFMRFDEVHFRLATALNAGDKIMIKKDNGDALTYGVDFLELEPVPPALSQPANYLSITDYGAVANDQNDDFAAFNACISAAAAQGKNVYIPAGRFLLSDKLSLNTSNIKIQGAGIWYTEVFFSTDKQFYGGIFARASNVEISHFTLATQNNDRLKYDEVNPRLPGEMYKTYKGFMGTYGTGSRIHDIWVEHFECGFWIAGYDAPYPVDITTDLQISKCRIRNNYADGVNFCQGTSNSIVEQCSLRNNGDDALAVWPNNAAGVNVTCRNDIFRYNTVENTWRAGGAALFGGTGHEIHHSLFKDGVAGSAIRFTNDFGGFTFEYPGDVIRVYENTITGCGTSYDLWDQKRGAIEFYAGQGIFNLQFDNNTILRSQRDAIQMYGNNFHHLVFNNTIIDGTGLDPVVRNEAQDVYGGFGLYVQANTQTATFNNLTVTNAESGAYINKNTAFNLVIQNINIPVSGVSIKPARDTTLTTGQSLQLSADITPVDATNKVVTWRSSDTTIAKVDATGKVTTVGYGTATITVTTASGNFSATRKVSILPGINIVATQPNAAEGGSAGVFTISTAALTKTIQVKYAVSGTASTADYTPALSGSVTLTPATPAATITITPVDDNIFEGPEMLRLTLLKDTSYNLGGDTTAVVTIADNENPPCVSPVVARVSGTVDASWSLAPVRAISNVVLGAMPADYSGKWRALYDNTNLYFLVEVTDNNKFNDSGASWWEDDVIEIFIDGDNSKGTAYDGANDFQLGFRWNDPVIHVGSNSVTRTTGITFTQTASSLKVTIPWTTIGVTPAIGRTIGIDVQVDDDDNGGTRDAQLTSFATNTTAFQNPSVFGTVYLTTCTGTANQPPLVNAGPDQVLPAGTATANLSGTATDPEGQPVTYTWSQVSGPATTISNVNIAAPTVSGLSNGNTYIYQLSVSDGTLSTADLVQITVGNVTSGVLVNQGTPVIDGTLESKWQLSQAISKTTTGSPNNTATFGLLWDANYLYVGFKVLDAALYNDSPDAWDNDAVEVYIDANNNKLTTFDGKDNQFIKAYNSSTLFAKTAISGAQHAYANIPGGYSIEIAIPWSQLNITPAVGTAIGFDAGYDDDDNGGARDGQAVWYGAIDNYQSTAAYGTIVLAGTTAAKVATMTISPNPAVNGRTKVTTPGRGYIVVYDMNGKQVYTAKAQPTLLLNMQLPKGMYIVKYIDGENVQTKSLIIQ